MGQIKSGVKKLLDQTCTWGEGGVSYRPLWASKLRTPIAEMRSYPFAKLRSYPPRQLLSYPPPARQTDRLPQPLTGRPCASMLQTLNIHRQGPAKIEKKVKFWMK